MVAVLEFPSFVLREYPSENIEAIWEHAKTFVERALDRGSIYSLSEVLCGLIIGEMQLWTWADKKDETNIKAAMVTAIQEKDGKRWCLLLTVGGGNMEEWLHHLPDLEGWARLNDCHEMQIYGRIGWSRVTGYTVDYTKMSKGL